MSIKIDPEEESDARMRECAHGAAKREADGLVESHLKNKGASDCDIDRANGPKATVEISELEVYTLVRRYLEIVTAIRIYTAGEEAGCWERNMYPYAQRRILYFLDKRLISITDVEAMAKALDEKNERMMATLEEN